MSLLGRLSSIAALLLITIVVVGCSPALQGAVLTTQVDQSGRALNSASAFSVDTPRILCSVPSAGLASTAEISAKWLYNEGGSWKTLKDESFTAASAAFIVFSVNTPDNGWRQGDYSVRLSLNGRETTEKKFSIIIDENMRLPVINNFSATPVAVTAGQPLTLSWNVDGATRVSLSPEIGSVDAGGSRAITPRADTTYTLTALSDAGPSSKSISVKVLPPVTETADLAEADLFREASMVYYSVRNNGSRQSNPSSAKLYIGMNVVATGYIPPMAPGEQRTLVFGQYSWSLANTTPATVCIDTQNENGPSNALDKCLTRALAGARVF